MEGLAAYTHSDLQPSGAGDPVKLTAFRVTAGFFQVLGLRPARGREFSTNDELPGNGLQVILSDRMWRARFGAAEDILGRQIMLDARPFTVVALCRRASSFPAILTTRWHTEIPWTSGGHSPSVPTRTTAALIL